MTKILLILYQLRVQNCKGDGIHIIEQIFEQTHCEVAAAVVRQISGEVSGVMRKLAPTLLKLRRVDKAFAKSNVELVDVHSFEARQGTGRYIIVVNEDFHNPLTFSLALDGATSARDVLTGKLLKAEQLNAMTLPPGEGVLLELRR